MRYIIIIILILQMSEDLRQQNKAHEQIKIQDQNSVTQE